MTSLSPDADHPDSRSTQTVFPPFLRGGGESGALIRSVDWSKTPVGPIESWPQSLRIAVGIMLDNKFGMYVAWGKEFTQFYNDGYRPILGSTKHPTAMGNTTARTFAESWHIIQPLFEKVMQGESVGSEDWLLPLNRHGYMEDCYFTFSYSPIRDESGNVGGVLVTVTETTARVQLEQSLTEAMAKATRAERVLQDTLVQAPVGIASTSGPDHVFSLANPHYMEMLFGRRRDLLGKAVRDAVPEVRDQGFIELLDAVYRTGVPFIGKEVPLRLLQPDGTDKQFFVNFIYQAMRDDHDHITGILCVVYDVTELVLARRTVDERTALLDTIARATPDFIFAKDLDGKMVFANPAIFETLGKSESEVLGHTDVEFLGEEIGRPIMENDRRIMTSGRAERVEEVLLVEGRRRHYVTNKVPYRGPDGEVMGLLGISRDVTDLREAQGELSASVDQLKEERELRERFVSTLTHDLRSPLAAAKMSAHVISRSTHSPEKITSLTGRIVDSLNRANQMIENLLDANRIKAGEPLHLEMRQMDLFALVSETLNDLTTTLGDRFVLSASEPKLIGHWSNDSLRRIVENLCSNAVKYGSERSPVTVRLSREGDVISMSVHNSGNPIPDAELGNLFDPFKRATTSAEAHGRGWGLGLTLAKGLTEAHLGTLRVESSAEQGTTFTVVLPIDGRSDRPG